MTRPTTPTGTEPDADDGDPVLAVHVQPRDLRDRIALRIVKTLRIGADWFFAGRYGHRAVVLETIAAVPGMVGGLLQHLKAIRQIRDDQGWIRELVDEAENERMHLMTFIEIARPTRLELGDPFDNDGAFYLALERFGYDITDGRKAVEAFQRRRLEGVLTMGAPWG